MSKYVKALFAGKFSRCWCWSFFRLFLVLREMRIVNREHKLQMTRIVIRIIGSCLLAFPMQSSTNRISFCWRAIFRIGIATKAAIALISPVKYALSDIFLPSASWSWWALATTTSLFKVKSQYRKKFENKNCVVLVNQGDEGNGECDGNNNPEKKGF